MQNIVDIEKYVRDKLFELRDEKYKAFHSKLIPNVAPDTIIGVRTPELRRFAKEFSKLPQSAEFLKILPHKYYDENNLHGFLIERIGDYEKTIEALDSFLPYVDNWATCDLMSPKIFKKNLERLTDKISQWLASGETYTARFAIEMLMKYYLDENFKMEYADCVADIRSDEYYVNMMIAWYFATALAKQYDSVIHFIENERLDKWVHNKTIQKSVESFRITDEQKAYLKSLRK